MFTLQQRIEHLIKLGQRLCLLSSGGGSTEEQFLIDRSGILNPWFTKESILFSLKAFGEELTKEKITSWISDYNLADVQEPKEIGLVLAGNIPLVGLHDIICVFLAGYKAKVKLSVKDQELYHLVRNALIENSIEFEKLITFTEGDLKGVDAIIATGSDNTSRYFEYYFNKYPHIIRKNRTSVAVLNGHESENDLKELGRDIFTYFGLGCRNVSHLILPEGYSFEKLFKAIEPYNSCMQHNKYANNYDYQRVVALMNQTGIIDQGFVLFTQTDQLPSPIGVIHYHYYKQLTQAIEYIEQHAEKIQCIITSERLPFTTFAFGMAQKPALNHYADHVDTLQFLVNLK